MSVPLGSQYPIPKIPVSDVYVLDLDRVTMLLQATNEQALIVYRDGDLETAQELLTYSRAYASKLN